QFASGPEQMRSISPLLGVSPLNDRLMGAGSLSPQCVEDGVRFDDRIGQSFLVVAQAGSADIEPALKRMGSLAKVDVLRAQPASQMSDWLKRLGLDYAVVRPDRYLLGGARNLDGLSAMWQRFEKYLAQAAYCT